ncbi:MAG: 50S ribosomal protein L19 [Candidatus Pacebacteria bacterium]|nr:50S ribosomal protein L19 [Candidatus Paceibacterota bacterium]
MVELKMEEIKPGMTVRILQKIPGFDKTAKKGGKDGERSKTQQIEGLVIARKHGKEAGATITVRKIIDGVGVEWIIPVYSPNIKKVELVSTARVRRAKLNFLRDKSSRQIRAKIKERNGLDK